MDSALLRGGVDIELVIICFHTVDDFDGPIAVKRKRGRSNKMTQTADICTPTESKPVCGKLNEKEVSGDLKTIRHYHRIISTNEDAVINIMFPDTLHDTTCYP